MTADITRLAFEQWATGNPIRGETNLYRYPDGRYASPDTGIAWAAWQAAESRTLALQQGKAGGVAEIPTGTTVSVDVSTGDEDFEHRIFATVIGVERGEKPVILCEEESRNFAPPANSPEARVMDEMVERAAIAVSNVMRPHPNPRAYWEWLHEEERAKRRDIARAVIAVLAQQPSHRKPMVNPTTPAESR